MLLERNVSVIRKVFCSSERENVSLLLKTCCLSEREYVSLVLKRDARAKVTAICFPRSKSILPRRSMNSTINFTTCKLIESLCYLLHYIVYIFASTFTSDTQKIHLTLLTSLCLNELFLFLSDVHNFQLNLFADVFVIKTIFMPLIFFN